MWGLHKFPIDGWLVFFGDGCFLRWGKNCVSDKRLPFRYMEQYMDLSFFSKTKSLPGAPEADKPEFADLADWSFDFGGRFGLDNIINSISVFRYHAK